MHKSINERERERRGREEGKEGEGKGGREGAGKGGREREMQKSL